MPTCFFVEFFILNLLWKCLSHSLHFLLNLSKWVFSSPKTTLKQCNIGHSSRLKKAKQMPIYNKLNALHLRLWTVWYQKRENIVILFFSSFDAHQFVLFFVRGLTVFFYFDRFVRCAFIIYSRRKQHQQQRTKKAIKKHFSFILFYFMSHST